MADIKSGGRSIRVGPEGRHMERLGAGEMFLSRPELWLSPLLVLVVLLAWSGGSRSGVIPSVILPAPGAVWGAMTSLLGESWFIADIWVTVYETLAGLGAATAVGMAVGVSLSFLSSLRRIVYPFLVAFQVIPTVAIAPAFVIWFGFGASSKVAIAFFISFFPVVVHVMTGLRRVPPNALRLMTSLNASRRQIFFMLSLPSALPYVFAGIKTASTLALVGAIVGEYILAQSGLGKRLIEFSFAMQPARVWATIVVISAFGLTLYGSVVLAQLRLVWWENR